MNILNFPSLYTAPNTCTFSLVANTQIFESPLNRTIQTVELPGARWVVKVGWNGLTKADARQVKAWLAKLRGMSGRFYFWDVSHESPSGTALGSPLVKGAGQSGCSLLTDGWDASQSALLLPGDYIGVGGELKIITDTIASDASGNATLVFEPPIRTSPGDNTQIIISQPKCVMRLKSDEEDQISFEPPKPPEFILECVEVFA